MRQRRTVVIALGTVLLAALSWPTAQAVPYTEPHVSVINPYTKSNGAVINPFTRTNGVVINPYTQSH
ncbi:MAG: hypothetical protein IR158_01335 [Cellulomonas sp.]|uniref:hypothetical protein n=1 Tax=Cellulomonas sp. TaxID=40001 RepID=UPI0019FB4155|nr:hypothetical protein [Cellulomonas sp.]MBF0686397.1 hypothetical protein [Cellulomonas sp.]